MTARSTDAAVLAGLLPVGVCWFDRERLAFANPALGRLFGFQPVLGATMAEVAAKLGDTCAGVPRLTPGSRMVVVVGGQMLEIEAQEIASHRLMWVVTDTSVQLRLHSQLAEITGMLAFSHEAFLIVGQDGAIRYANEPAERERGHQTYGLVGLKLWSIERWCDATYEQARPPTAEEALARIASAARDGRTVRYHAWHRRTDGSEIPTEVVLRRYHMENETVVIATARDDSRRLMHLQALTKAKAEAEAANRAKSSFLAITSHELRTPLTGIMGFCELLQLEYTGGADDATARYIKLIAESSQHLLGIINDIVDMSKIEARTLELRPGRCDAEQIADLTLSLWSERAKAKGLALLRHPSTGRRAPLATDALRVRQMLDNLLSNAVKFSSKGTITLAVDHLADAVEYTVADQGPGIPSETAERMWEAFWQGADCTTRESGGSGLGLYITRCLAEMLGGRIWLHKTGPAGSVFRLRLPRKLEGQDTAKSFRSDVWLRTPSPEVTRPGEESGRWPTGTRP